MVLGVFFVDEDEEEN